jgi:hypothetical protein
MSGPQGKVFHVAAGAFGARWAVKVFSAYLLVGDCLKVLSLGS